ncbi:MAG: hypothetical protein ACRENX_05040 [Candidatus Dormibacteria bacterium]
MKFLRKRSTIVLASIGAMGAIAALATAASFALFYDPPAPVSQTFATGTVTVGQPFSFSCNASETSLQTGTGGSLSATTTVAPGYSTHGYPGPLGDESGTDCTFGVKYTGTMDAYLATDVSVSSPIQTIDPGACTGGDETGSPCQGLYSPNFNADADLQVWGTEKTPAGVSALGIGNDQTISQPGTNSKLVDLGYTSDSDSTATCNKSTGQDCPVMKGYTVLYRIYVYWPQVDSADQNVYQDSQATISITMHAVQAYDNSLLTCSPGIVDPNQDGVPWGYQSPDQPRVGWGTSFDSNNDIAVGNCPIPFDNATSWTPTASGGNLYPFGHLSPSEGLTVGWSLTKAVTS